MRKLSVAHSVVVLLFITAGAISAQQFTGGIRGAVRDALGVIPGTTVVLINEGTTVARETVTNDVGEYAFVAVPPATYTLRTSLPGYRTVERRGLVLGTQEFLTLDLVLEVGSVEEQITVTADASLIERSNASTGDTLDRETLDILPTHGRNPFLMAVTIPTVVPTGNPRFDRQLDQNNASALSMGGGSVRSNNYLLDGVPITDLQGRAIANPSIETLGDVKVQIRTYDAEMGRTGGGVFNSTARSGTNEWHGSGFFQTRPVWGQALDFFSEAAGLTKQDTGLAEAYYRVYGGGAGGPIIRNRTFFWAATEGFREKGVSARQQLWPTARQKLGDFSTTTDRGRPVRIWNPYCRSGVASARCPATGPSGTLEHPEFANAVIPTFALNPVARNMIDVWPLPNRSNEDTEPNQVATPEFVNLGDMLTLKVDHKFSDSWSLSGLYLYNRTDEPGAPMMPEPAASALDTSTAVIERRPQLLVFNNTNILDDSTVLTLRYGWTTFAEALTGGDFPGGPATLGFSPTFVDAIDASGRSLFPRLEFTNYRRIGVYAHVGGRWKQPYAVNVALSKLVGSHTFKIGGDVRRLGKRGLLEGAMGGRFFFDGNFTEGPNGEGGFDLASFLVGTPRATSFVPFDRGETDAFTRYYAAYAHDDWRVSPRLTLNYGVRLEREEGLQESRTGSPSASTNRSSARSTRSYQPKPVPARRSTAGRSEAA